MQSQSMDTEHLWMEECVVPSVVLFQTECSTSWINAGCEYGPFRLCRSPELARALQLVQRAGWLRAEAQLHHMAGSYQQAIACLLQDSRYVVCGLGTLPSISKHISLGMRNIGTSLNSTAHCAQHLQWSVRTHNLSI